MPATGVEDNTVSTDPPRIGTLKERFESHPVVWGLALLAVGFGSGFGARSHRRHRGRLWCILAFTTYNAGGTVSELDRLKEQLVYLRFWQGIMVVTDIGLVGWLASAADIATPTLLSFAIVGIIALSLSIFLLHRQIERRIEQIGRL